jgi:transaldolase
MGTKSVMAPPTSTETDSIANLRSQHGCGPIEFAGTDNALYERHLVFDNVVDLAAAGPRERFEAIARSVRDILSQRWIKTARFDKKLEPVGGPFLVCIQGRCWRRYHESERKCLTGRRLGTLSAVKKPRVTLFTDVPARGPRNRGDMMKATQLLHNLGQSLWLDNITRDLLNSGTLKRYIDELSVTGLTSNPTIFDHAIKNSTAYDAAIREKLSKGKSGEALFFELALEDITRAASLFLPVYDRTDGVDGWVSLEVSPLLAYDTASTLTAAKDLHARAGRPNLFIKIPGTQEGLPAIEEAIFAGIPINVTLLFSREHYVSAAEAFLRGIERRIDAGLEPGVGSVASVFISRWDAAVMGKVPDSLRDQLGIAIAKRTYKAYRQLLASPRWQRVFNAGARPQRLLWASTGTKDPKASDVLYIKALAAPLTVNTMPEGTLKALADHGELGTILPADGGDCEEVLAQFAKAGIDVDALAAQLQDEGAKSFVKSWNELMAVITSKSAALKEAVAS